MVKLITSHSAILIEQQPWHVKSHEPLVSLHEHTLSVNAFMCGRFERTIAAKYDRPGVLGCEPVEGVLDVLSSNQLNIVFVHRMWDVNIFKKSAAGQHLTILFIFFGIILGPIVFS